MSSDSGPNSTKENDIADRAKECISKGKEKEAYNKIKQRFSTLENNKDNRDKLIKALKLYYDNAEPELPWSKMGPIFESKTFYEVKDIALEISGEAINRDMIDYIRTGKRGDLATRMYNQLK